MPNRNFGLGRIHMPDERDHRFLMPQRIPEAAQVEKRLWVCNQVLDQGDSPMCVGYSTWNYLAAYPVANKPKIAPAELYHEAQKVDEWPGEDYEGTSVRGAFKVLKNMGYVESYSWAFDVGAVVDWILTKGPVVVGTDWYDRMFTPEKGFIRVGGKVVGGHAWLILGADRSKKCPDGTAGAGRMIQTWGRGWGENGRAWISFTDLDKLIKANGEAATAKELLLAA